MLNELAIELYTIGAVKFGSFTLKSGLLSPIYIDLRLIISYPHLLKKISHLMWEKVATCSFDCICGVPYTALPIATAMSLAHDIPMVMRRKEVKSYGTKKKLEGAFQPGQTCLVVEDLITSGLSIFETIEPLQEEGLVVRDLVVLLDHEQGGRARVEERGYHLFSVLTLSDLLLALHEQNKVDKEQVSAVKQFIAEAQC